MSNVTMALVSIVNTVSGDANGQRGRPASLPGATLDAAPSARAAAGRERPVRPRSAEFATTAAAQHAIPLAAVAALIGAATLVRHRLLHWGASTPEQHRLLAGDEFLPTPNVSTTRSITIRAGADHVWPWLAQLGQGRGGFYSYDRLENTVVHIDIHNTERIVPEWQQIAVGDEVRLVPEIPLIVVGLEKGRALVLRGSVPMGRVAAPYEFTWAFVLLPRSDGTTRLVVRERYAYTRRWAALIVQPATLVSCFMSPKMLRGIKSRAEISYAPPEPNDSPSIPRIAANGQLSADSISAAR